MKVTTVGDILDVIEHHHLDRDCPVRLVYEAGCCQSDDIAVSFTDFRLVLDADGWAG